MNSSHPYTVVVAGLGALGTVFATLLKKAGHSVFALTKEKNLSALSDRKVSITGIWGAHEATLDGISSSPSSLVGRNFDIILITVKSYDTFAMTEEVKSLAGRGTLFISAQNGYGNYETVSDAVGKEHTLLARIIFGAKLTAPGRAEVTVIADDVRIGQPHRAVEETRIREIASVFSSAGIPTAYAADIESVLWDKILYNAALNPLGALLECTYGQLAGNAESRRIMDAVISEIFAVARAKRIPLSWPSPEAYREHFYGKLVPPTAAHYPSMYYDVKSGKRLEIEALNGAVVRLARENGIKAPVNEIITGLIKAKEAMMKQ